MSLDSHIRELCKSELHVPADSATQQQDPLSCSVVVEPRLSSLNFAISGSITLVLHCIFLFFISYFYCTFNWLFILIIL